MTSVLTGMARGSQLVAQTKMSEYTVRTMRGSGSKNSQFRFREDLSGE